MPEVVDVPALMMAAYVKHGYAFFDDGDFDLNLFGVRHPDYGNLFNDLLGCICKVDGLWRAWLWRGTTDPGGYYLRQPMTSKGTAIVVPGQHRSVWRLGKHNGKYEALVQRDDTGSVRVYRDVNKDTVLDLSADAIYEGHYSINCHRAGEHSQQVDKWSAGCQVHGDLAGFFEMMWIAHMQPLVHPGWTKYTYTLFTMMDDPTVESDPELDVLFGLNQGWIKAA